MINRITIEWIWLRSLILGPPRLLVWSSFVNAAILRRFGAKIGKNARIHSPITLHAAEFGYKNLVIGAGSILNGAIYLDLCGKITLECGVSLGPGVIINTHNRFNYNEFLETALASQCGVRDVYIGEGTGIKANSLIVMGVTIGKNSVVASHAVVNRNVPDCSFVAGVPAIVKSTISIPSESTKLTE